MTYLRPLAATLILLTACSQAEAPVDTNSQTAATSSEVASTTSTQTETEKLNAWFARRFEEEALDQPEFLAQLGRKDRQDEWNDETKEAWQARMDRLQDDLDYLATDIDLDALDEDAALSHRLYVKNTEDTLEGMRWYGYAYSFNQMFGTHSGIPTFLLNQHKVDNETDALAYITRLETVGAKLDPVTARSADSFDRGINPPKFVYAHVIRDIDNVMRGAPFEEGAGANLILNDFTQKIAKLDLSDDRRDELIEAASDALQSQFAPAYQRLKDEMLRQQAAAGDDDGAWKLPEGEEYYAYQLRMMTTTNLSADEIHDIGLREVARIHDAMRDIMETVRFEGSLQDFFEFMRTSDQFYYETTPEGKERYLTEATQIIDTMTERLPEVFNRLPKAELEVRAVEAFREQSAGKAFYSRPAADGSRPGYYYANLYDMGRMPTYQMEALAYHEGNPGHHMQIAIAQELEGVPNFRKFGSITAYIEGWGLYSEYLPKEMGFYEDPYSDFGRLAMELWRAGRLVVDTGLHSKRWTRQEAIDYLAENTPNPEGDIVNAIERYIVMPGQATAYMIGKIKILELRERAKSEMGDAFDIRDFHDVVLASGAVPLNILEERVDAYIATAN